MIEEIITQFKGKTFSSHDEVVAWLKEKLTAFEKKTKEDEQDRIWAYMEEYAGNHLSDDAGFYHYPTVMKDFSNIIFDKTLIKKE